MNKHSAKCQDCKVKRQIRDNHKEHPLHLKCKEMSIFKGYVGEGTEEEERGQEEMPHSGNWHGSAL